MIKLAIFDLDGTLVNSIEDLADSCNKALTQCSFPTHDLDKYYYFVGEGVKKLVIRALPEENRDDETIEKVLGIFSEDYNKNYINKTIAYNEIPELLSKLTDAGILIAVASNKPDEFTKKIIEKLFPSVPFSSVVGNIKGVPHKPDPQIVFNILSELDVSAEETVFIGDTKTDIETGKNAGAKTIGCLWGFREINELKQAKSDFIATHPLDIFNYLILGERTDELQH